MVLLWKRLLPFILLLFMLSLASNVFAVGTPSSLSVQEDPATGKLVLYWDAVPDASQYIVALSEKQNDCAGYTSIWVNPSGGTGTRLAIGEFKLNLKPGHEYYFSVKAQNGDTCAFTNQPVITPQQPGSPKNFAAAANPDYTLLTWDYIGPAVKGFRVNNANLPEDTSIVILKNPAARSYQYVASAGGPYCHYIFAYNEVFETTSAKVCTSVPAKPVTIVLPVENQQYTGDLQLTILTGPQVLASKVTLKWEWAPFSDSAWPKAPTTKPVLAELPIVQARGSATIPANKLDPGQWTLSAEVPLSATSTYRETRHFTIGATVHKSNAAERTAPSLIPKMLKK